MTWWRVKEQGSELFSGEHQGNDPGEAVRGFVREMVETGTWTASKGDRTRVFDVVKIEPPTGLTVEFTAKAIGPVVQWVGCTRTTVIYEAWPLQETTSAENHR